MIKSKLIQLSRRMVAHIRNSGLNIIKDGDDSGILNYYKKESVIHEDYIHMQWVIDAYLLTFYQYLNKNEVNNALELIRSRDKDNQLIGLNALYNLQFNDNQINLKLYENGQ